MQKPDEDVRQKTQGGGESKQEQQVETRIINSAVVRVCQLRMIDGWLIFLPLCLLPDSFPRSARDGTAQQPAAQPRKSAAATRRSSCTRMLNVRQAAPRSITSSPMPREVNAARIAVGGNLCVGPVPNSTSSGFNARMASRCPGSRSAKLAGSHCVISVSAVTMQLALSR